ncbi:glycosyltransferase family 2 protein [Xanthomarina sp. F2636L]|nr:glycosyltransferase family 2 protein [Xanthomarina sp. F2636L]
MIQPHISIIIPTYNRAHCIGVALQSVLDQSYVHWECLIVDDGSTDASKAVINSWVNKDSRFQYHTRTRLPKGAPTCRNIGLAMAQGSYVIFLDSDDYLLPHCLEQRVAEIEKNPGYDFLVFPMAIVRTGVIRKQEIPVCEDYLIPFLSANLLWQTMCPIWKTSFLKTLNGFTEGYPRFNDPELMIRALLTVVNSDFKVFADFEYDTVHIRETNLDVKFINKVYNSLLLFIPDITMALKQSHKINYKKYLAGYLHLWFRYIFTPTKSKNPKQSVQLLVLFYRQDIISFRKMFNLMLRLFIYVSTSLLMKQPINKLNYKYLYL